MTDLDLTKLREIAEAATPGPWNLETQRVDTHYIHGFSDEQDVDISVQCDVADAAHIATFDPPTVLALIAENNRMRGEVERLRASLNEARQRLSNTDWSSQAEDRNRAALLHIEAALNGTARPLNIGKGSVQAMHEFTDEELAEHDREVAAKALRDAAALFQRLWIEEPLTQSLASQALDDHADRIEAGSRPTSMNPDARENQTAHAAFRLTSARFSTAQERVIPDD